MSIAPSRLLLPLSLSLLRGVGAYMPLPGPGTRPSLLALQRRFSLATPVGRLRKSAPRWTCAPPAKNSLGLALLLGGTATGLALNLRRANDDGAVLCEAGAGVLGEAAGGMVHRIGHVNELPGGLVTTEHFFSLPLRYDDPASPHIEVFVRELGLAKNKGTPLPGFVFLQGGPGFPAGRPLSADSGWVKRALQSHSVFMLDQRGTGRSTAVTWETLAALGGADVQADYVSCMRADSIVKVFSLLFGWF